jgi:hypothetical protein
LGVGRVLEKLESELFRRQTRRCCEPPLALPLVSLG